MRVLLASTSPARRALLDRVGLRYEAVAPEVDEVLVSGVPPAVQAERLALQKAEAVARRHPDAVVIGADQVLALDDDALGKPADAAAARAQLARMSGRAHVLVTGLAVLAPGRAPIVEREETRLWFRALTDAELDAYVATGEWRGCAGAYRIEARGLLLMERIQGDHENILGLPMLRLLRHLRGLGVAVL